MASMSRDRNGTKRILFTDGDGERKAIRLGKASVKAAEAFRLRVEALLAAKVTGTAPDRETAAWLAELPDATHGRLARVGLAEPREGDPAASVTLGQLLTRFEETATVKPATKAAYRQSIGSLRQHFGDQTLLNTMKPEHADAWHKALKDSKLAKATVSKRVRVAKAIFNRAIKWRLIPSSPFAELRPGPQHNPDRAHYIAADAIVALLAACPDDQWRGIISLVRFAGLRCPSELVGLRWGDVNWERGRLSVRSPKTAGHGEGHAMRVVPIAPELRPILLALFEAAEPGAEAVIPRLRDARLNLRTHLYRIIHRAGLTP
jgi:integrase